MDQSILKAPTQNLPQYQCVCQGWCLAQVETKNSEYMIPKDGNGIRKMGHPKMRRWWRPCGTFLGGLGRRCLGSRRSSRCRRSSSVILNTPRTTVQAQRAAYPAARGHYRHCAWDRETQHPTTKQTSQANNHTTSKPRHQHTKIQAKIK